MPAALWSIVEWLALPLSGAAEHSIAPGIAWHARFMVLAWAILLPLGVLAARYLKILPGQGWPRTLDNPLWWHLHRSLNYLAVALSIVALYLAWRSLPGPSGSVHALLGWAVSVAAIAQVAGGWLRGSKGNPREPGGDHYAMTRRRLVFERVHKSLGWLAIVLAAVTIALGLVRADAPRWMALVLAAWGFGLVLAAAVLQRRGWCADTYQAIYGPDPGHPGNRMRPIGWGVRRGPDIGQVSSESSSR